MKTAHGSRAVWVCGCLLAFIVCAAWSDNTPPDLRTQALALEAKADYKGALQAWQSLADKTKDKSAKQAALSHVALLQFLAHVEGKQANPTPEGLADIVNDSNYPAPVVKALALWYAASLSLKGNKPLEAKEELDLLQTQFMDTVKKSPMLGWIPAFLPRTLKELGGELTDAGELTPAHEVYVQLLKDYPDSKDKTVFQARMKQLEVKVAEKTEEIQRLRMEKKYTDAANKCLELLAKYSWSESVPWLTKTLALTCAAQKNYSQAVQLLQKVAADSPDKPIAAEALLQVGVYYQGPLNDLEVAVKTYEEVVQKFPKLEVAAVALFQMGVIYNKIGDPEAGKQSWQKLIETFPANSLAAIAKEKMKGLSEVSKQ